MKFKLNYRLILTALNSTYPTVPLPRKCAMLKHGNGGLILLKQSGLCVSSLLGHGTDRLL